MHGSVRDWWELRAIADSLYLCCCLDSVEWCALDVLPKLGLPKCPSAQLPNMRAQTHAFRPRAHATQEANYGHQQELDMIPLMMQKDYSPKGWLGLILGTRMWYATNFAVSPLLSFLVFLL